MLLLGYKLQKNESQKRGGGNDRNAQYISLYNSAGVYIMQNTMTVMEGKQNLKWGRNLYKNIENISLYYACITVSIQCINIILICWLGLEIMEQTI